MFRHKKSPYWHAAAKSLGRCHNIRPDPILLPCIHRPGASHSALNLIQNQQDIPFFAQRLHLLHEFPVGRINAAFTLHRFKQYRTGFFRNQIFHTVEIVHFCKADIPDHRPEGFPVTRIARYRQSAHRPSMEGMFHGDDFMIRSPVLQISIFPRRLNGSFHRFRPAVRKKYPIHAGSLFQFFRRFYGRHVIKIIGSMDQLVDLGFQRVVIRPVMISKGKNRNAGSKVQIAFPFDII